MKYWIKERHTPQLGVYYTSMGQMSVVRAKDIERTAYGRNIMHPFKTLTAYQEMLSELKQNGEDVS